jgi:hypothetical protein
MKVNHQPSTINHQPSTINHQPSTINHQPSTINHQPFYYDGYHKSQQWKTSLQSYYNKHAYL